MTTFKEATNIFSKNIIVSTLEFSKQMRFPRPPNNVVKLDQ